MKTPKSQIQPTRLGTVEDVSGATVRIKLEDGTATGLVFVRGEGYRVGQVGGFIRIPAGFIDLYGIVTQVGAGAAPVPSATPGVEEPNRTSRDFGDRWMRVELVGQGGAGRRFERGIAQYPTIGDVAHLVTDSDLATIYAPGEIRQYLAFGRVASAESIPAYLNLNRLIPRHSALVGSTGAGKSTTVAALLGSLADRETFPGARIVLVDLHGEYARAFGDAARVFRINPRQYERSLHVPYWALSFDELTALTTGTLAGGAAAQLAEIVTNLKRSGRPAGQAHGVPENDVTSDSPLPFSIHQLWHDQHAEIYATHTVGPSANQSAATRAYEKDGNEQDLRGSAANVVRPRFRPTTNAADANGIRIYKSSSENSPLRTATDTLEAKLKDPRLAFLFQPGPWAVSTGGETEQDLQSLFEQWIGPERPITVLDLSGVPPSIVEDLVGAVLRILFDGLFWARHTPVGGRQRPLLVALEEAHVYLQKGAKGRAAVATRRIAKEGRKYGVGLMLISQRPSEIDETILSQCGTILAMRLTNETDRAQVRACASDNLGGLFAMLPVLRTGEVLVVGEAVDLPLRALVSPPPENRRPDGADPFIVAPLGPDGQPIGSSGWREAIAPEDYAQLVARWRAQNPNPGQ